MRLLSRRDKPPRALIAQLTDGERVVSWADTAEGSMVVATQRGLLWPEQAREPAGEQPREPGQYRRIGWERIDKATWRDGELIVVTADVIDDLLLVEQPPLTLHLTTPRDLPHTVRKRIDANVVHTAMHPVPGGSARFVARRVPGKDGLVWWARLEPEVTDDELVRAAVRDQIAALSVGLDAGR
jgi:hypothetical protein